MVCRITEPPTVSIHRYPRYFLSAPNVVWWQACYSACQYGCCDGPCGNVLRRWNSWHLAAKSLRVWWLYNGGEKPLKLNVCSQETCWKDMVSWNLSRKPWLGLKQLSHFLWSVVILVVVAAWLPILPRKRSVSSSCALGGSKTQSLEAWGVDVQSFGQ